MSTDVWVEALGARVQVHCPDDMAPALRAQWRHCLIEYPGRAAADEVIDLVAFADSWVAADVEPTALPTRTRAAEYRVASVTTLVGIGQHRGRRLMLHAAGVGDPLSGRVAALVAASGTGKTTAAARLSASGLAYLTDEAVAVDEFFLALPYPKPLSFVVDPQRPSDKSQHGPDELGMDVLADDCEIGAVVLLRRDPERTAPPELSEVDTLEAVLALIPQTSALPSLPGPLARLVALLRHVGGAHALDYRDVEDTAALLRGRLRGPARRSNSAERTHVIDPGPQQRWQGRVDVDPGDDGTIPASPLVQAPEPTSTTWVRGPFLQALSTGDRVIVLAGVEPFFLDGVGATLWLAADDPRTFDELLATCEATHGSPPPPASAADLVASAITQLAQHRILIPADD